MKFDLDYSIAKTFGIAAPDHLCVPGAAQPGPLTPPSRPDYRFRPALLSDLLAWHQGIAQGQHHDGLWLTGPMGAGKSSLVGETAARLNLNLVQANGQRRLELADLVGHLTVLGGDVLFQDGPLTLAARHGWWFMLNEADLVEPGELAGLNTLLDGGPLVLAENGGEVVHPAPGFGLIATANTVGLGDATGLYAGTQRLNAALLDRFWVVNVDYPEPAEEAAVVRAAAPGLPIAIIEKMVEVAGEVRRLFLSDEGGVDLTFSTRTLVRWAYLAQQFRGAPQPLEHALRRALTNRAEPETAAAIHGIVQRRFGGEAVHAD
ncbi:MAG TPA: CbbQ/NirQ/NorQ C-terminal domain-containing protein [Candidatus Competibacter sp.]|nr:CbbQ/NirQ/NorQ C-terminal domain-containing protein [Candidatus Competibacter sp.]